MAATRTVATVLIAATCLAATACGDDAGGSRRDAGAPATASPSFVSTQLDEIQSDITMRTAELKQAGADVALVKVDPAARVVDVTLRGDVSRGADVLYARYPREALRVHGGDVSH